MTKASDNVFPRLLVSEGGSTATPAAGNVTVYAKADGLLYSKDDAGTETLVSGGAGGGGGGVTHTYYGYNAVGASEEQMTAHRMLMKKITLAAEGTLVAVEALITTVSDVASTLVRMGIYEDNAGTPRYLLAATESPPAFLKPSNGSTAYRWFGMGLSRYLAAGSYWIGVLSTTDTCYLKYDTSGADRYYTNGGSWLTDAGYSAITTGTRNYSIRASVLS